MEFPAFKAQNLPSILKFNSGNKNPAIHASIVTDRYRQMLKFSNPQQLKRPSHISHRSGRTKTEAAHLENDRRATSRLVIAPLDPRSLKASSQPASSCSGAPRSMGSSPKAHPGPVPADLS
jgi:hypothetical protein